MTTLRYSLSHLSFIKCSRIEAFVEFISESETQVLCSQVPSAAACSSEIDPKQIEGALQDLCVSSPTQPAADLGNQI